MTVLKDRTDTELIAGFKDLYEAVYNIECFGTNDLRLMDLIERELGERGYSLFEGRKASFKKEEN